MKQISLKKNREVSERVRYRIGEISQDLIGYYKSLSKFGIKDSRGYIAYSNAIRMINLMPDNEGRDRLYKIFNFARGAGHNTLDKMITRVIAEIPEFKKKRRRPYVMAGENNEYRR